MQHVMHLDRWRNGELGGILQQPGGACVVLHQLPCHRHKCLSSRSDVLLSRIRAVLVDNKPGQTFATERSLQSFFKTKLALGSASTAAPETSALRPHRYRVTRTTGAMTLINPDNRGGSSPAVPHPLKPQGHVPHSGIKAHCPLLAPETYGLQRV